MRTEITLNGYTAKSNIPAVVIMFVQRINIPGYNVYTDLNQKNLFKTVDS